MNENVKYLIIAILFAIGVAFLFLPAKLVLWTLGIIVALVIINEVKKTH